MATTASLSVKLGIVTVGFKEDTDEARAKVQLLLNNVKKLGDQFGKLAGPLKQFGGLLTGLALVQGARDAIAFADSIADLSAGFGISTASLLQMRQALRESGADTEGMEQALSKLYSSLEEARGGSETAITKFQELGITWQELKGLTPEDALKRVAEGLAGVEDNFKRVKLARELLGKKAGAIEFEELAKKLGLSNEEFKKHAEELKKIEKLNDQLATSYDNFKIAIASLIPGVDSATISVDAFKVVLGVLFTYFAVTRVAAFATALQTLLPIFVALKGAVIALNFQLAKSPLGLAIIAASAIVGTIAAIYALSGGEEAPKQAEKTEEQKELEKKLAAEEADRNRKELRAAGQKLVYTRQQIELDKQRLQLSIATGLQSEFATEYQKLELDSQKKLIDLQKQKEALQVSLKDKKDILALETQALNEQIVAEKKLLELRKQAYAQEQVRQALRQTRDIERQISEARNAPLDEDPFEKKAREIRQSGQQEIEDKVGGFTEGGYTEEQQKVVDAINVRIQKELELNEALRARSELQKVLSEREAAALASAAESLSVLGQRSKEAFQLYKAIAIAQTVISTIEGAQNAYTSALKIPVIGPFIAPVLAGLAYAAGLARVAQIRSQTFQGRQTGGPVKAGTPYTVGESGKETFVPSQNGTILNNLQTNQMENSGKNVTYQVSINALDSKSVDDLLSQRPELIYALNREGGNRVGAGSFR